MTAMQTLNAQGEREMKLLATFRIPQFQIYSIDYDEVSDLIVVGKRQRNTSKRHLVKWTLSTVTYMAESRMP